MTTSTLNMPEALAHGLQEYLDDPSTRLALEVPGECAASIAPLGRDEDHLSLLVDIGEQRFVVDVAASIDSAAVSWLAYEFQMLQLLEPHRIAPAPRMLDASGRTFPYPVLVREYLPGRPPVRPSDLALVADALRALHSIPTDGVPDLVRVEHPLRNSLDRVRPVLEGLVDTEASDAVSPVLLRTILLRLSERVQDDEELLVNQPQVIVHGDAVPHQSRIHDGAARFIFWRQAALDHPSADLCQLQAAMLIEFQEFSHESLDLVIDAYSRRTGAESLNLHKVVRARMPYAVLEAVARRAQVWISQQRSQGGHEMATASDDSGAFLSPGFIRDLFRPYLPI